MFSSVFCCFTAHCEEHQLECGDGHCIGLQGRANGLPDCLDGTDEDEQCEFAFIFNVLM